MCRSCKQLEGRSQEEQLEIIARAVKDGRPQEHFQEVLDELLGTEMTDRNREVEEAWEKSRDREP